MHKNKLLKSCLAIVLLVWGTHLASAGETGKKSHAENEKIRKTVMEVLKDLQLDGTSQTDEQKKVRTIYDDGFTMVGQDSSLKIGAWMQNDLRFFFKGDPGDTQFLVRRARIDIRGSLEKMFAVRVMGEFEGDGGTNAANLKEGWLEYNQFPTFRIKIGQFKEPYGLENLYGDLWLDFLERPMGENFIRPEQDLGILFFGKLFGKRLEYGVGAFNGSGTNVAEANDDKDFAGRIALTPWAPTDDKWLNHLTLAGSLTYGKQQSNLDSVGPTTPAATRYFAFVNPTAGNDVTVNDYRLRAGADVEWQVGPFSAKGEYSLNKTSNITFGGVNRDWDIHALHGQATYVLTGEKKSNQSSVVPDKPFNPKEGRWGAVEVAGRFESYYSDQGMIDAGFAAGTDDLWSTTAGINWYLNRHIRTQTNYVYTNFDDAVAAAGGKTHQHSVLMRFQFNL